MKRVVVGYDTYKFGHRAVQLYGTANSDAADQLIIGDAAPTERHRISGLGKVFGVAIAPESEVRGVFVEGRNGLLYPVQEGSRCLSKGYDLGQGCGQLIVDALDPHDGTLVLNVAETPDEVDALPVAPVDEHRSLWMQYDSTAARYRVLAIPSHRGQTITASVSSTTWEGRAAALAIVGGYVDSGPSTTGDHSIEFTSTVLNRRPRGVSSGDVQPAQTWQGVSTAGAIAVAGATAIVAPYATLIRPPVGKRGIIVAVTTAATAGSGANGSLHRIEVGKAS